MAPGYHQPEKKFKERGGGPQFDEDMDDTVDQYYRYDSDDAPAITHTKQEEVPVVPRQRLMSSDSGIKKVVKYSDWMNDDNESRDSKKKKKTKKLEIISNQSEVDSNYDHVFEKSQYEGTKGHLLLQLQKSYKGDDRFNLKKDQDFDIDLEHKDPKKVLPQAMLDALTKKEEGMLKEEKPVKVVRQIGLCDCVVEKK